MILPTSNYITIESLFFGHILLSCFILDLQRFFSLFITHLTTSCNLLLPFPVVFLDLNTHLLTSVKDPNRSPLLIFTYYIS